MENKGKNKQIPITRPTQQLNNLYHIATISEKVKYLHAAAFIPVVSMWLKVIEKEFFLTCPGLSVEQVNHHIPKSLATEKRHIDQTVRNIRSTKEK